MCSLQVILRKRKRPTHSKIIISHKQKSMIKQISNITHFIIMHADYIKFVEGISLSVA